MDCCIGTTDDHCGCLYEAGIRKEEVRYVG